MMLIQQQGLDLVGKFLREVYKNCDEVIRMKQLVFMIFTTFFVNAYAESIKDNSGCGYPINTHPTARLADDTPVMPINDISLLKRFVDMYKQSDDIKVRGYKSLNVELKWNNEYRPHLVGGSLLSHDRAGFLLYRVDINNDNEPEWVLVYLCEGSMCTSGIEAVYKSNGQVLAEVPFDDVITANFNLGDMSRWYLFIDDPLFTVQKGKVVFNFCNRMPVQVCSYMWENNKVTLVHGDQNYCIH